MTLRSPLSGVELCPLRLRGPIDGSWNGSWSGRLVADAEPPLSKDYERKAQTSEGFIEVAMIRLILKRLARGG